MYVLDIRRLNDSFEDDKAIVNKVIPLMKSVLGYTDREIDGFRHWIFYPPLAINLTMEQAKLAMQPFWDFKISVYVSEYDDNTHACINGIFSNEEIGIVSQPSQEHYYDEPVVRRDQLIDPWNPPTFNELWIHPNLKSKIKPSAPIVTCPYCKSTNTKKISATAKAANIALFGIFGNKRKYQWHCTNCGSDF